MTLYEYLRDRDRITELGRQIAAIERSVMVARQGDRDGIDEDWVKRLENIRDGLESERTELSLQINEISIDQQLMTKEQRLAEIAGPKQTLVYPHRGGSA